MQGTCPLTGQAAEVEPTADRVTVEHPQLGEYRIDANAVALIEGDASEGDAEVRPRMVKWILESRSLNIGIPDMTLEYVRLFESLAALDAARLEWAERQAGMSSVDRERLWTKLKLEWNYNSNHIEGNKLTYDETELLLFFDRKEGGHPMRDYEEMKAHDVAIDHTRRLAEEERVLGEGDIRDLNKILLKEPFWKDAITADGQPTRLRIIPGEYKKKPNHVRTTKGELYRFAKPEETPLLMQRWIRDFQRDLERDAYPIPLFLAESHWHFVRIHPFGDGNGRTARLLSNYVLLRLGLPPMVIRTVEKDRYFRALRMADAGHIVPLAQFMLDNVVRMLEFRQLGELLRRFGPDLNYDEGEGRLRLRAGNVLDVKFVVAQLPDGKNVLLFRHPTTNLAALFSAMSSDGILDFEGRTSDGLHVETMGKLEPQDFPGHVPREWGLGAWDGYTAQKLRVSTRSGTPDVVRYGLTNVRPPRRPPLPIRLEAEDTSIEAILRRVRDCDLIFDRVHGLGDTAVTCELEMSTEGHLTAEQTQQVVSDVCYLLSVAQGCKVEWTYCKEYDGEGLLCCEHWMRHTRPFGGPELVRLHWTARDFPDVQQFLQMTYPTYVRRRDGWGLTRGPIDMYLEAKADADFLETRAAKLAVALEALKHWYLQRKDTSIQEFILDPQGFEALLPELVTATDAVLPDRYSETVGNDALRSKLRGLNRESFGRILKQLARDIGLSLTSGERRKFIISRNSLVHRGQFFGGGDHGVREYFFMLNTLDRIFLKLVGYSGAYVDYRKPGALETAYLE